MRLGVRTRREGFRLAKHGQRHPDVRVSSTAFGWSYWRFRGFRIYRVGQVGVAVSALLVGIAYLLRGDGLTGWLLLAFLAPLLVPLEHRRLQRVADANGFRRN